MYKSTINQLESEDILHDTVYMHYVVGDIDELFLPSITIYRCPDKCDAVKAVQSIQQANKNNFSAIPADFDTDSHP